MKIAFLQNVGTWKRALNAARRTIGKSPIDKEPSDRWKAQMLLAEHSPIRLVEYDWAWEDIKQYVTTHLVRHHEGCESLFTRKEKTGGNYLYQEMNYPRAH